jgi:hypothetical protein
MYLRLVVEPQAVALVEECISTAVNLLTEKVQNVRGVALPGRT